ncbi:hypothetical protein FDP41_009479 [Naegleria fowleri]|uniref:40S ribosomal protein S12 n=1 Tax=Naegleria fowleri TaxID=5763 RepID=A0A6A5BDV9_NAEFO|nr:uncharacterized protein FDP41_009491 [Naegleria fowleri]XP_044556990.1 uncharacterized protein FDP41_009479 [Naegleria fowleri]KAF0972183.1 hypothetical protein FDP41_009491 [Naegleria fowleri]KAF0972275.1 hypothetical protein FDP41_009479 [Naegleria fowleri]CAG4718663.1 unnamed protein product [Naegleria fowleri]
MSNVEAVEQLVQEPKEELNLNTAIKRVLKTASANRAVARGLREVCRTLAKDKAQLCVLADDCDKDQYKKLIKAFCAFKKVDLLEVPSKRQLGEWVGLAKYDKQMRTRRVQKCAVAVITDLSGFGEDQEDALNFVLKHLGKSE